MEKKNTKGKEQKRRNKHWYCLEEKANHTWPRLKLQLHMLFWTALHLMPWSLLPGTNNSSALSLLCSCHDGHLTPLCPAPLSLCLYSDQSLATVVTTIRTQVPEPHITTIAQGSQSPSKSPHVHLCQLPPRHWILKVITYSRISAAPSTNLGDHCCKLIKGILGSMHCFLMYTWSLLVVAFLSKTFIYNVKQTGR